MIRSGTKVKWEWGKGSAEGKVIDTFNSEKTVEIKGEKITRNGSESNPALLIEQADGQRVLKLKTEVYRADS